MKLTEKCKEDFENWILNDDNSEEYRFGQNLSTNFEELPSSFKYGVYVDFFDCAGIYISVSGLVLSKTYICDVSMNSNVEYYYDGFETRKGARNEAIEKANEIYNNI
tara:strand:+ start:205 stop:525 length:321 start_codon:yes stop_codon:yes gene_type:complete